jgi:hypothetical protein
MKLRDYVILIVFLLLAVGYVVAATLIVELIIEACKG